MRKYTIVLGEALSGGAKNLHEVLKQDLPEATFVYTNIGSLLINEEIKPELIVVDMSQTSFRQGQEQLTRLRRKFSRTGVLVWSENTELDTVSAELQFVTVYNTLLMDMFKKNMTTRSLADRAVAVGCQ